jgi:hypothetical protein
MACGRSKNRKTVLVLISVASRRRKNVCILSALCQPEVAGQATLEKWWVTPYCTNVARLSCVIQLERGIAGLSPRPAARRSRGADGSSKSGS